MNSLKAGGAGERKGNCWGHPGAQVGGMARSLQAQRKRGGPMWWWELVGVPRKQEAKPPLPHTHTCEGEEGVGV